jgi:transcriptional regulator with XRE-family HTH domain
MIGTKIRTIREQKKLKQLDVAVRLGIEQSTYAKIENNQISITTERLLLIAEIFEVPITDLLPNLNNSSSTNNVINVEQINQFFEQQNEVLNKQNELYSKLIKMIKKKK